MTLIAPYNYDPYIFPTPTEDETIAILYRHGETETNAKKLVSGGGRGNNGATDLSLNENGKKQAENLGDKLAGISKLSSELISSNFYTSHLKRAKETAEIVQKKIAKAIGMKPALLIEDENLREKDSGIIEGLANAVKREYHYTDGAPSDAWETSNVYWDKIAIPGEETPNDLLKRTLDIVNKIVQANRGKIVFVATSGKLMRRFAAHIMDLKKLPCPVENGTAFFVRYSHKTNRYAFLKAASLEKDPEFERNYYEKGMPQPASMIN